jgi:hypothetical protein
MTSSFAGPSRAHELVGRHVRISERDPFHPNATGTIESGADHYVDVLLDVPSDTHTLVHETAVTEAGPAVAALVGQGGKTLIVKVAGETGDKTTCAVCFTALSVRGAVRGRALYFTSTSQILAAFAEHARQVLAGDREEASMPIGGGALRLTVDTNDGVSVHFTGRRGAASWAETYPQSSAIASAARASDVVTAIEAAATFLVGGAT